VGVQRDPSPYGSQTLVGPGWPDVDEEVLSAAAEAYEQLAAHLTGVIVPRLQSRATQMGNNWTGPAATAALGEASAIIGGHQINAAEASAIALKLRAMETSVTKTKALANTTAQEIQHLCEAATSLPQGDQLIQSLIKFGQSQNIAYVAEGTSELAANLGAEVVNPAAIPIPPGGDPGVGKAADAAQQAGGQGSQQIAQMMGQLGQVPQQLGKSLGGGQGLQQLMQPLQQISSMFGKGGGSGGQPSPFAAFSNHPAAGGSGARAGAGLGRGGSVPGAGGSSPRTPLMAKLVGRNTTVTPASVEEGAVAGKTTIAGTAPVNAGGTGGMGGAGMAGHREPSGGSRTSLAVPAPLDQDLAEDDVDEDW
jgi:hypothetical protein